MKISDWLIILAIIIGPILAVQIQKWLESIKEKKAGRLQIFKTLMSTRADPLHPRHVESLNMIDTEFYGDKKVIEAWKLLLDNFFNYPQNTNDPEYQAKLTSCTEKSKDLLADLLYEMATSLNYAFDKVHLKRGAYIPKGHMDYLWDQELIRHRLIGVLFGQIPIPIKIVDEESQEHV